jgi:hypothetical protein
MTRRFLPLAFLFALMACESETAGPAGPNPGNTGLSARIDGAAWSPDLPVTAVNGAAGLYSISGFKSAGYTMVFQLANITGPGTYALGVDHTVFGGAVTLSRPPSSGWSTPLNGAAGELIINTLTATRMAGTFHFDAAPLLTGTTGNPRVTDGVFDLPVSGTGGVALANQGNKVTGTMGGTSFAASSALATITNVGINSPLLTITATNGTRSISIGIAGMTGPGTYALSSTTPVRSIGSSGIPGNLLATWASQGAGGSGVVQITSVTSSRIIGSFNATLVALGGGATGNLTVTGNFDMARLF